MINIKKQHKISNPFLCLDAISSADLTNILDYIYNGEVQIYQKHLYRFMNVGGYNVNPFLGLGLKPRTHFLEYRAKALPFRL